MSAPIIIFIVGIVVGFVINVAMFRWTIRTAPDELIAGILKVHEVTTNDEDHDDDFSKTMNIEFEEVNNKWHAYNKERIICKPRSYKT